VSDTINDMTNMIDQQQLAQDLVEAARPTGWSSSARAGC